MKLAALALDYDGTIAVDGVFDPRVREAIAAARRQGIVVVLVTGRRLGDLRHVAGDLTCFDVVVAENGAVVDFPTSGRHVMLVHQPDAAFVAELQRRGVATAVGEAVIEADATAAPIALDVLRRLELPLVLMFNRGRLMMLPPAVAKSTGLLHALSALRLSIHNTVGIGDAENDHDLIDACEVGVAVAWGSAALRAVADEVISGSGPPAVADYITRIAKQPRLSAAQMGRRHILLGREHNGDAVNLTIRGRTILVAGEPGTGKSWLAGLICEQLILQGYCVCVIDPEGDYRSLEALPSVVSLGGDDPPPSARDFEIALRHSDLSVIVDLSKMSHREKAVYIETLLPALIALRRRNGLPHKILLDEAHYFLHRPESGRLIDAELAGYVLVTYRVSGLAPSIRSCADSVVIVTREADPQETATLSRLCRPQTTTVDPGIFKDLATNEAAILPGAEESGGRVRRFSIAPRLTAHVRHQTKYLDMPVLEHQAFFFSDAEGDSRARSLKEFMMLLPAVPEAAVEGHLRRHDFSRWIRDVFHDHPLATHIRGVEDRVANDAAADLGADIIQAVRARYLTEAERVAP